MIPIFNYTINSDNFCIKIYIDTQTEPLIYQPTHPDGSLWPDQQTAISWAENYIAIQVANLQRSIEQSQNSPVSI
jgi:hypothetical protein